VAERDRAAKPVDSIRIGAGRPHPCEYDWSESLVHLEGIEAIDRESGAIEQLARRRYDGREHEHGIVSCQREMRHCGARLEAKTCTTGDLARRIKRCTWSSSGEESSG
jgi:hypothetical protein